MRRKAAFVNTWTTAMRSSSLTSSRLFSSSHLFFRTRNSTIHHVLQPKQNFSIFLRLTAHTSFWNTHRPSQTMFIERLSAWSQRANKSPYEILGVSPSSTEKEIKLAYFRQAKKFHPDLNPDDPQAKVKFQEVSAAFELLSDPVRRRHYDTTGFTGDTSHQSQSSQEAQQQHAEEMFYTVQQDVEVVRDAIGLYFEEMQDEMNYAIDCVLRRDWRGLGEVANAHKGIVIGVVVPTILFLRYPPAVFAIMRVLFMAGQLVAAGLMYTGNVEVAVKALWRAIVKLSLEQKRRSEEKRKTR